MTQCKANQRTRSDILSLSVFLLMVKEDVWRVIVVKGKEVWRVGESWH